ncbi:MAG: DUF559 domain-containing protein [Planctomycetes bacterium]|nr:DUF559 domain-containing protein [Planctomycetota bacterium]
MSVDAKVLVAILRDRRTFKRVSHEGWYHIPVESAEKWVGDRWPPEHLAFYQTKEFGSEAFGVQYHARVRDVRRIRRGDILRDKPHKARLPYFQLLLEPLQRLAQPIRSYRQRYIVFIPTVWSKFTTANELNDLFDDSPLEDTLWGELKRLQIRAERQFFVDVSGRNYALDFAIYCASGKLDVETDGDTWHANPERSKGDNLRDNDLQTSGWRVLRFSTPQIRDQMVDYCLPQIVRNIDRLGGVDEGRVLPRQIRLEGDEMNQLELFGD